MSKSGVPRVVWNRPRIGHKGPVRRSTPIDEIPFLAVARSLGDLWSYNSAVNEFVVSPNPDVSVIEIDPKKHRCLIFGTDGLWNVLSPKHAVEIVHAAERENIRICLEGGCDWKNPSKLLVNEALERWSRSNMKADNTSVVIIMLDPPGPPKRDVLRSMRASIQHIDYQPTNTHPMHNMNVTLFDHTTRELIDLSQVTCQEAPPISQDDTLHQPYLEPHASTSYQDMGYSNSFADSYNTYLNSSLNNDHSYTSHTTTTEQYSVNHSSQQHNSSQAHGLIYQDESIKTSEQDTDDTYSLTNLQTKSERLHSQMLEASTTASTSRYQNTGNVAIIENFHDYPMPHMPTNQPYDNQFHHQTFQQDQPSYQMERFDYNHHQNDQNECNFSSSHYTAHDLSEQNYQREHEEYLYHEESSVNVSSETNTMIVHQPSILNPCLVESSKTEETNTTVDSLSSDSVERRCVDRIDEEDIQINEISSSNLNVLSPVQEAINHSDSDSCASGDESKASSSTSRAVINSNQVCSKKNSPAVSKTRSSTIKKSIKKIVRIVYETRSSDRPHRTRSRQESLKLKSGRTINNRLKKFFNKNSQVKGFLEYRRVKHVTDYRLTDNNNCAIKSNNNNVSAAATSKDSETNTGKRILRSSEGTKSEQENKPLQRTRKVADISLPSPKSQSCSPAESTRRLTRHKLVIQKVIPAAKRVRR